MSERIPQLIFLGTEFISGKGGVASVLKEYKKIFPNAHYISTTKSEKVLENLICLLTGLLTFIFFLIKKEIKIVHIHGSSYNSFYRKYLFFKLSQLFRKEVVFHIHGAEFQLFYGNSNWFTKFLITDFLNNAGCIICLSYNWKNFFEENFKPKKIEIVPNIVPLVDEFKHDISSKSPLNLLFLGHISKRKGVWILLKAFQKNKEKLLGKVNLKLGGNGEIDKLKHFIKNFELEELVEYVGWVFTEKKEILLREADIFILPSYNEGLPISVLEALSYGLPVISTPVGGIPEIVEDGKNGILVKPGDEQAIIEAIHLMVENKDFRTKAGKLSYEKVQPHFPDQVKEKLILIYKELL